MLTLEGVSVAYGAVEVLHDVSLRVDEGEMVCLLGANGAGKSTTVRTISGLLRPKSGVITFRGQRLDGRPAHAVLTRGIAQCPEGRRIFPEMTVRENLEMGAYVRGGEGARAEDLERVFHHFPKLKERAGQLGGTLSGGEQQMLAIARALMSGPRLLLLDEPSLGLAPTMVATVFRVIREIRRQGVTVLMVEQNAALALQMADRAYVMESGRIALGGPAKDLLHNAEIRRAYLGG
ncbi:MAG TPA: ABC transporter ATP-binding protein [Terriglobales bacterium]|nr:ABC transporter ATP-binding protein [Terriglobales bacterium]